MLFALVAAHAWVVMFVGIVWQVWWLVGALLVLSASQLLWSRGFYRRVADLGRQRRLEVAADRITLIAAGGLGTEIVRGPTGTLVYDHNRADGPHIRSDGPAGAGGPLVLRGLNLDEVREASLSHGWRWEERRSGAPAPEPAGIPPGADPAAAETELVLREGPETDRLHPHHPISVALIVVLSIAVGTGLVLWSRWALLAFPVVVFVYLSIMVRITRLTLTVSAERLALTYTNHRRIIRRPAVASVQVGKRAVVYRDERGHRLFPVPFRGRRDDVLATLALYGWPTDGDALTGM